MRARASLDADLIWRDFVKQYLGNVAEADIDHKASVEKRAMLVLAKKSLKLPR